MPRRRTPAKLTPYQQVSEAEDAEDRAELIRRWRRLGQFWGLGGLRDGFREQGWTDEDLCWAIRTNYIEGRCEFGALCVAARDAGVTGRDLDDFRAVAEACPPRSYGPHVPLPTFYPVGGPPDAETCAAWAHRRRLCFRRRRHGAQRSRQRARQREARRRGAGGGGRSPLASDESCVGLVLRDASNHPRADRM